MRRRVALAGVAVLCALGGAPAAAHAAPLRAGAAAVDATYHVGASAGQYASSRTDSTEFDPFFQQTKNAPSYGIQSRLEARALVVEEQGGKRIAIVKTDLYIPQDLLWRRAAQEVESRGLGIDKTNLIMAVTHDHSSPYYSSTSWGAWTFQDVFDVRFYTYMADRIADAVEQAVKALKPARMGASTVDVPEPQRNALGPAIADDGTPAGFPQSYTDHELAVVRFDDISNPRKPKPLATLVDYSLHGEFLEGNDLISADWVGPMQRMVDRETGGTTLFVQNAVGTTEPANGNWPAAQRLMFSHYDYGQAEYGARLIADGVLGRWRAIGRGGAGATGSRGVPFTSTGPVAIADRWFPGPLSHPYPGVSNCRTDKTLGGEPQLPVVGLPDCSSPSGGLDSLADLVGAPKPPALPSVDPGLSTDDLESAGIPVPENYSAPGYTGLEESTAIHLQAFRLGPILFTVCSCEQWVEQSRNIKSRTDTTPGNEYLGYDWGARCTAAGDGRWSCPDPRDESKTLTVSDQDYRRMRAQVNNPADGWNDPSYALQAESEPVDTTKIKGNYTQDDTPANARYGYRLTIPMSMANDYNGYIASYREYQRGDHYRKALTGWGPHSSDYLATRLVQMGRGLNGGAMPASEPLDPKVIADQAFNDRRADTLGRIGASAIPAYEATLPDDDGTPAAVTQPKDVQRFDGALFSWVGGSNYTDNPEVVVQRRAGRGWRDFADMSGEIPVTLAYPAPGARRFVWTASFEAFVSRYALGGPRATPAGTYRFVVDGAHRTGGKAVPYRVTSREFSVSPWPGVTATTELLPDRRVAVTVGPRRTVTASGVTSVLGPIDFPDTYKTPVRFVREQRTVVADPANPGTPQWYCNTCSFRPWADTGDAASVTLLFTRAAGGAVRVPARREGDRWISSRALRAGESAVVPAGGVVDAYGDFNGASSAPAP